MIRNQDCALEGFGKMFTLPEEAWICFLKVMEKSTKEFPG